MQRDVKVGLVLGVLLVAVVAVVFFRRDDDDRGKFTKLLPAPDAVADRARGMLGSSQPDHYPVNSEFLAGSWQGSSSKPARTPTPSRNKNGELAAQIDGVENSTSDRARKDSSTSAQLQSPDFDQRSGARSKSETLSARGRAPHQDGATRSGNGTEYTIQEGDTLSDIARRKLGSATLYQQILDENRDVLTDAAHIPAGKTIRIPTIAKQDQALPDRVAAKNSTPNSTAIPPRLARGNIQESAKPATDAAGSHVVKEGDTLVQIARRYYGHDRESMYLEILHANPELENHPASIRPGMILRLP